MAKLQVVRPKHSLIYSMKLIKNKSLENWQHEHITVKGPDGEPVTVILHLITGTKEEIKEQLLQSVEAFFELADDMP